jgi:hypothetical protein
MSIADSIVPGYPGVAALIQDDVLVRAFQGVLFAPQIWRSEASDIMPLEPNYGVSRTHTRNGRMTVNERPKPAGVDPVPKSFGTEQWTTKAKLHHDGLDIHLTIDKVAAASTFLQRIVTLGQNAGETVDRLPRNALFAAYGTGHSLVDVGVVAGTSFTVSSIAGFQWQLNSEGVLAEVSANNPKQWYRNPTPGASPEAVTIIGAVPADANVPLGRGTLTTSANTTVVAGDVIRAYDAPVILRVGDGSSVDAITANDQLRLTDIRRASSILSDNFIPKHPDGYYHCHLPPTVNANLFNDAELQALNDGRFGDAPYRNLMLGILFNCIFIENPTVPRLGTVTTDTDPLQESRPTGATASRLAPLIGIEMINASGVPIMRVIITGGGALIECPSELFPEAKELGWAGEMRSFQTISSGNIQANTMGIRLILRAPVDRLGKIVSATWEWGGDFGVPSDALGGFTNARFKRAIVIECADPVYN